MSAGEDARTTAGREAGATVQNRRGRVILLRLFCLWVTIAWLGEPVDFWAL
jgi:hypothetical protein